MLSRRRLALPALTAALLTAAPLLPAAPPAVRPLSPATVLSLPLEGGPGRLPAYEAGEVGEGVPVAFDVARDGSVHLLVPHARAILVYDAKGTFLRRVDLRRGDGSPLPDQAFLYDLSARKNGWLVLDKAGGWAIRFSTQGLVEGTFGHFVDADRLEVASDGNVVVGDRALGLVNEFDPAGTFLADVKDPHVWPLRNAAGRYIRTRIVGDHRGFVWLRGAGQKLGRLVALVEPATTGAKLYHLDPLGFDSSDRLYVLTVEKTDETYTSHVVRYDSSGRLEAVMAVAPNLERLGQIPRFFRLLRDGRLLGFAVENGVYRLVSYDAGS